VNANSIIAPGAVVGAGKVVASGEYWAGNPAAKMRDLSAEEIEGIKSIALENFEVIFTSCSAQTCRRTHIELPIVSSLACLYP
jgi:carbonic anhydrase/acetyltransferase-like protein (isoleucine patch superfamily)